MTEAIYRKVQRGKRVHYELVGNAAHWHSSDFDVLKPRQAPYFTGHASISVSTSPVCP